MSSREPTRTPREVLAFIREREVKAVDLRFMDFPGLWQHFTIPAEALDEDVFEDGLGFDGSSIRGWQAINESDMLVCRSRTPRSSIRSASDTTLAMICNIQDPLTKEDYTRDPRNVARKAVNYMKSTGIADTALLRPGARVLRLRRRAVRPDAALGVLLPRQRRGAVEHRPRREAEPRLQAAVQGRLLPVPADRRAARPPHRDDADDDRVRHDGREPAPRGGRPAGSARSTCGSTSW